MRTELEKIIRDTISVTITQSGKGMQTKVNTGEIADAILRAKFMKANVESCPYFDLATHECCSRENCNYQIHIDGNTFGNVYGCLDKREEKKNEKSNENGKHG